MRQLPENFFGWNDHKSIMLTKFATLAAAMGCVVMVLCGPRIVSWVLAVHALQLVHGPRLGYFLLGLGYCSAALALWMLYNLYMFLARIEKEEVFGDDGKLSFTYQYEYDDEYRLIEKQCVYPDGTVNNDEKYRRTMY